MPQRSKDAGNLLEEPPDDAPTTRQWYTGLAKPLASIVAIMIFIAAFFGAIRSGSTPDEFFCLANGTPAFPWKTPANLLWDPSLFLSITISFGSFTFANAKLIDIAWDIVFGRGGQLLLAIALYPLLRRSLVAEMEKQTMHIPLVAACCFNGVSFDTCTAIFKEFHATPAKNRDEPGFVEGFSTWRLICFLFVITYVLTFGTFLSAITGYQAQMEPFCARPDTGDLLAMSKIEREDTFVLGSQDYGRIGLNQSVVLKDMVNYDAVAEYYKVVQDVCGKDAARLPGLPTPKVGDIGIANGTGPALLAQISWMIREGKNRTCTDSAITINGRNISLTEPPLNMDKVPHWFYTDITFTETWMESNHTICQPGTRYGWGFASSLFFTFCLLTLVFACVVMALQLELWWHSRANKAKQHFSIYADIIDLANMITEEFSSIGESMRVKDLGKQIKTRTGEVYVGTDHLPQSRRDDWKQSELRRRIRRRWESSLVGRGISQARNRMSGKRIDRADAHSAWPEVVVELEDQRLLLAKPEPSMSSRDSTANDR